LIPKHIAKKHGAIIRAQYPGDNSYYNNQEMVNMAIRLSSKYIRQHSVCPKCRRSRTMMEHITGWICTHCGACWEDFDLTNLHWSGLT
jgi:ribosomal protein S27AE